MPAFRRRSRISSGGDLEFTFKLLAAVLVISLYLFFKELQPTHHTHHPITIRPQIQYTRWNNGSGKAQDARAEKVKDAMIYTFQKYREKAWGKDDILPVSGGTSTARNGWGAFIVESASTLALMGMWEELDHSVEHILTINFAKAQDLVDPFETTIRYLGGLLSIIDLYDAEVIPEHALRVESRDLVLEHAVTLAGKLGPAYDTPSGMPWPRVDFVTGEGKSRPDYQEDLDIADQGWAAIGPARSGSSILENRVLMKLLRNDVYMKNSTKAWVPLVWPNVTSSWAGIIDSPISITTGRSIGHEKSWDAGHDSYYEYLLKITILAPPADPYLKVYKSRFLDAAYSLRDYLSSRSAPARDHLMQHLFIGSQQNQSFQNKQSHLACFAPGTLLLASQYYKQPSLRTLALAVLEGCHHTYSSTPTKIGPDEWSWIPKLSYDVSYILPKTDRQKDEVVKHGFWSTATQYKGRPEYVESLFYAWRITGERRYREWAWEAFEAMEKYCKSPYGYAQLRDVYDTGDGNWVDTQESFWAAETLKYLWLIFSDVEDMSLDKFVFSTVGHPFQIMHKG